MLEVFREKTVDLRDVGSWTLARNLSKTPSTPFQDDVNERHQEESYHLFALSKLYQPRLGLLFPYQRLKPSNRIVHQAPNIHSLHPLDNRRNVLVPTTLDLG